MQPSTRRSRAFVKSSGRGGNKGYERKVGQLLVYRKCLQHYRDKMIQQHTVEMVMPIEKPRYHLEIFSQFQRKWEGRDFFLPEMKWMRASSQNNLLSALGSICLCFLVHLQTQQPEIDGGEQLTEKFVANRGENRIRVSLRPRTHLRQRKLQHRWRTNWRVRQPQ